jgi:hypothetical protein
MPPRTRNQGGVDFRQGSNPPQSLKNKLPKTFLAVNKNLKNILTFICKFFWAKK